MGYGGQPMKVVKANRALLKKRNTFKKVKEMFLDTAEVTELEFKEVSPEKLEQIKNEIRRKAKEAAWRETGIFILCSVVVMYSLYWVFFV